jgi:hypothetical protein
MLGRDRSDPLFLQVKEAGPCVLADFARASEYASHGQRVVAGQRLMQAASDILLGRHRSRLGPGSTPHDFYIRQLRDWKASADIATMTPAAMRAYGQLCGWTLARAHPRSGDRIAIAAHLGRSVVFDQAIGEFAAAYADQNERDYDRLAAVAGKTGRVLAERDTRGPHPVTAGNGSSDPGSAAAAAIIRYRKRGHRRLYQDSAGVRVAPGPAGCCRHQEPGSRAPG